MDENFTDSWPQATLETVLKVSQNRPQDEVTEQTSAQQSADPTTPGGPPAPKAKEKHREQPVETEVDRIIDAQDNEYVLSRPKYASDLLLTAKRSADFNYSIAIDSCHAVRNLFL